MLTRVRAEVVSSTKNKQVPWSNSSLLGEVYLRRSNGSLSGRARQNCNSGRDSRTQPAAALSCRISLFYSADNTDYR